MTERAQGMCQKLFIRKYRVKLHYGHGGMGGNDKDMATLQLRAEYWPDPTAGSPRVPAAGFI